MKIESILKSIASDNQNQCSSIVAPISLTGRVINATIWEEELWQLIHKEFIIEVGSFVRLRNINNSKLSSGVQCEFRLHEVPVLKNNVLELVHKTDLINPSALQ